MFANIGNLINLLVETINENLKDVQPLKIIISTIFLFFLFQNLRNLMKLSRRELYSRLVNFFFIFW